MSRGPCRNSDLPAPSRATGFRHFTPSQDVKTMTQPTPATVLVVEDDLDLRATIVESLEASGFAAAQASDAADAIDRLQGFAYDGLVVDLKLPDADGMTVLDEALARYPLIRAVVITGFGGVEEAVTAIRRGAVDFLIKPFQLSQLSRVLRTGLEQLRLREENASLKAQLHERFRFDNVIGRHSSVQSAVLHARTRGADEQHGADPGRDRHRQGARGAHHSPQQPARRTALRGVQRGGHSRAARRGRAVRPRQGCVYRRDRQPAGPLRAGASRHALHRRGGVDVAVAADQAAARAAGARGGAPRRRRNRSRWTSASSPPPTWI